MDNIRITVFTPTYNRIASLPRCFECLKKQTYKNFEWIIIDDGSTDGTDKLVESFKSENPFFELTYIYQQNSGKHTAKNRAAKLAKGEFFITLDSDDACTDDALEVFLSEWEKIPEADKKGYYGICCRTSDLEGNIHGTPMNCDYIDSNDLDFKMKHKIKGELWGMVRTDVVREFPSPEEKGFKFYPENIIWNRVGRKYKARYINKALRYYINDQTNAVTNVNRKKPSKEKYCMHLHYINECWDYHKYNRKRYIEHFIGLTRDGKINGKKLGEILSDVNSVPKKIITFMLSPIGYILYKK